MRGERREPEGIEHGSSSKHGEAAAASSSGRTSAGGNGTISGSYDHSQEYDPYQSAARQMQELLFGTSFLNSSKSGQAADTKTAAAEATSSDSAGKAEPGSTHSPPSLKPSTNSAFQKYVPANVPSTAEITSRLSGGGGSGGTSGELHC